MVCIWFTYNGDGVFYLWGIKGHMLVLGVKPNSNLFISFSKNVLTASYVLSMVLGTWDTAYKSLPHNSKLRLFNCEPQEEPIIILLSVSLSMNR